MQARGEKINRFLDISRYRVQQYSVSYRDLVYRHTQKPCVLEQKSWNVWYVIIAILQTHLMDI